MEQKTKDHSIWKEDQDFDIDDNTKEWDKSTISKLHENHHVDRCIGSLLGVACGDILGANLETMTYEEIILKFGMIIHSFIGSDVRARGDYTDDTEMTMALATSLIEHKTMNAKECARSYVRFFLAPPARGYGSSTTKILKQLAAGADYTKTGTSVLPQGSYANGGVMRIAPVGLAFRNASSSVLERAVTAALLPTHVHPEGVEGAFFQAWAIAELCKIEDVKSYTRQHLIEFLKKLLQVSNVQSIKEKLQIVVEALEKTNWTFNPQEELKISREDIEIFEKLAPTGFQIRASEALSLGFYAFGKYGITNPELAVIHSVNWGGDADTEGAIVGALCGALHGTQWIPQRWFDKFRVKNIPRQDNFASTSNILLDNPLVMSGRQFIIQTAQELAKLDLNKEDDVVL